jgi:chorismate mutase
VVHPDNQGWTYVTATSGQQVRVSPLSLPLSRAIDNQGWTYVTATSGQQVRARACVRACVRARSPDP